LQLANSSTIRYTQLFSWPVDTQIFCNRGTSGIDGSTATAVGASVTSQRPTVLITGDLSFFYDINGLWSNYLPNNFKIIIINNEGGGIFRILPGEKDSLKYDTYFETIHQRNARYLAKTFGFGYRRARSLGSLKRRLSKFFTSNKTPQILEIQTPRKINDTVLLNYFKTMDSKSIFS
jgi:2-succinyl-5-enolpyruvyl-6-hydroxy-3-cyclohexene-1-carboxylate synthase